MSKSSNKSSKDSQSMKEMSPEAQKLYKRLIKLSKTTIVKPKIVSNNDNSARVLASENLKKPNVILAIEQPGYIDSRIINTEAIEGARELHFAKRRISTREDRAEFLTGVYLDSSFPISSRLQAIQLLGKMYGDYLDRVVLEKQKVEMPVINVTL